MKNIKIASALAALGLVVAGSVAAAPTSAGGTITFTGVVTDETCTITGGTGTDGGQGDFTVALAPVPASQLPTAGSTANQKPFQIIIGGQGQGTCVDGKIATMRFLPSSPRIDALTGNLSNALTGEATNTEIQLLDAPTAGNALDLRTGATVASTTITNNTATIDMAAQYYATDAAGPGLVSTSVVYAVSYN